MVNIKNWVVFPERVELPITTCNLYEAYGLSVPNTELIDEKMRTRLGPYLIDPEIPFDFEVFRKTCMIC